MACLICLGKQSTSYVCNGKPQPSCTLEGNVITNSSEDWLNLVQSGCTEIDGHLVIGAADLPELSPPALSLLSIGGLIVAGNNALSDLTLPALTEVNGLMAINDAGSLFNLDLR